MSEGVGRTLIELKAWLIAMPYVSDDDGHTYHQRCTDIADAEGVSFLCPTCFESNGGSVGTHGIICWSPNVPQTFAPTPGRWELVGTSMDDLSLVAGSSSVALTGDGCKAHFFVTNGSIADRKLGDP